MYVLFVGKFGYPNPLVRMSYMEAPQTNSPTMNLQCGGALGARKLPKGYPPPRSDRQCNGTLLSMHRDLDMGWVGGPDRAKRVRLQTTPHSPNERDEE